MQKLLLGSPILFAALLAGCGNDRGEGPMEPGIYAYEGPDGSKHRMVFGKDGTYSDMQDNVPKPVEQGEWFRRDAQLCMKSEQTGAELCLDEKAMGDEGDFSLAGNGIVTNFKLEAKSPSDE